MLFRSGNPNQYRRFFPNPAIGFAVPRDSRYTSSNAFYNSGYDLEFEFYNSTGSLPSGSTSQQSFDLIFKPKVENGARGLYYTDQPLSDRTMNANTSYLGWWDLISGVTDTIVRTHTRLDLHAYSNFIWGLTGLFSYTRTRLNDLAASQRNYSLAGPTAGYYYSPSIQGTVPVNPRFRPYAFTSGSTQQWYFEYYPIFSMEASNTGSGGYNNLSPYQNERANNFSGMFCYSGSLAGTVPIVGQNLTFDQLFNHYLCGNASGTGITGTSNFRAWKNSTPNAMWIKEPDGYVIFDYQLAYYARPQTA